MTGVDQLRLVQSTLVSAPENIKAQMLAAASEAVGELWVPPMSLAATTELQKRVILPGAAHEVSHDRIVLTAAASTAPLSGGLIPAEQWHGAEFGATRRYITANYKGKPRRQLIGNNFPARRSRGYIAFHTARRNGPRIVAAFVHGAVKGMTMGNPHMETS